MIAADDYAHTFVWDLATADLLSPRSTQDDDGLIGASSFACREQLRRILTKAPKTDSPPKTSALIGSYIDLGVKAARKAANPRLEVDLELPVELPNGFRMNVHPDEVDPDEPAVTDLKTKNGLAAIRKGFVEPRNRIQRHIQFFAAWVNGLVPSEGTVRNVFMDRSGKDPDVHVEQEPFDMAVVKEATEFLDDALYAIEHGEEAQKDIPRYRCIHMCAWYSACRGPEIPAEFSDDPDLTARIAAFSDARKAEKAAKALQDSLRDEGLEGLTVRTTSHRLTSMWQNPTNKAPYWKLTVEDL